MHKGHFYINGIPGTGKTTFAKAVAAKYFRITVPVWVLSPKADFDKWPCNWITKSPERFFKEVTAVMDKCAHPLVCFIDEAGEYDMTQLKTLLTRGREYGVEVWLIAQRYKMVEPDARNCCDNVIAFRQCRSDAVEVARDKARASLETCAELPYFHAVAFIGQKIDYIRTEPDGAVKSIKAEEIEWLAE